MSLKTVVFIINKVKRRVWSKIVKFSKGNSFYFILYRSYWNSLFSIHLEDSEDIVNFFTSVPNRGAGIGHQMANWIAGYWYSKKFGLSFAHVPFASKNWESILGFGESEKSVNDLVRNNGYTCVRLPLFDESKYSDLKIIKKIIKSYAHKKVIFITEQDQFYREQFGVMEKVKEKFHNSSIRKEDKLIYNPNMLNIAVHIRRGDIDVGSNNKNHNLQMRWQNASYFENILSLLIKNLVVDKTIAIYLFSQGKESDFSNFGKFENLQYCFNMSATDSFVHMVFADILITSKSSFSYKPALLSNGIKICPRNFWHGYPEMKGWILANDDGIFDINLLKDIYV